MISQPESAWVVNVGERRTYGTYKGVNVKVQERKDDKIGVLVVFDIYLDDVLHDWIITRSPLKAIAAAKAAIDAREST